MTSPLSADPPSSRSPSVASHQVRPPDLCLWASIAGIVGCVKSEPCSGMCTVENLARGERRAHVPTPATSSPPAPRRHPRAHPGEARDEVVPNSKLWSSRWLIRPKYQMLTRQCTWFSLIRDGFGLPKTCRRLSMETASYNNSSHSSVFLTPRSAENRPRPRTGRRARRPLWRTRQGRWSATEPPQAWPSPPARPPPARPGLRMRKRPCYRRIRCARGDARALFRRTRR